MKAPAPQFSTVFHGFPQFPTVTVNLLRAFHHSLLPPLGGRTVGERGGERKATVVVPTEKFHRSEKTA